MVPSLEISVDAPSTMVPTVRFGAVLHRSRTRRGQTLASLARGSDDWLPDALIAVERGAAPLTDPQVVALARLYELDGHPVPRRDGIELVLDRTIVSDRDRAEPARHLCRPDETIVRFLALAVLLGPLEQVPLRLSALAEAVDLELDDAVERADRIARHDARLVRAMAGEMRARTVVPEAGLLVAECPSGTLVVISRIDRRRRRRARAAAGPLLELLGAGR